MSSRSSPSPTRDLRAADPSRPSPYESHHHGSRPRELARGSRGRRFLRHGTRLGYASDAKKRAAEATGVLWAVKEKAKPGGRLTARQRARNHRYGRVRAKVEHVFRVVKCQFGYRKVRYRGIAKNGAQVFSLLALANLYLARRTLASA